MTSFFMKTEGTSKINPQVPLIWWGMMSMMFGSFMLLDPAGFLKQYQINVSHMTQGDRMRVESMFQQWGIWNLMLTGFCSIACRAGSGKTRTHINLGLFVSCIVNMCTLVGGWSSWIRVGVSSVGMMFNGFLMVVTMILCMLGASLDFELAPIKKPIYWGSCVMSVVGILYALMFLLAPETMMNSYHVAFDSRVALDLMLAVLQWGWSAFFFQMSVWLMAGMMTPDFMYIYVLTRYVAMMQVGMFFFNAANVAWWVTKNEDGVLDSFIFGQYMNCLMSFIFLVLTYGPVVMLDNQLSRSVAGVLGGKELGSPTLLSPPRQDNKKPLLATQA
jgi:hypothetical protein